jgi:hypothetical protein
MMIGEWFLLIRNKEMCNITGKIIINVINIMNHKDTIVCKQLHIVCRTADKPGVLQRESRKQNRITIR